MVTTQEQSSEFAPATSPSGMIAVNAIPGSTAICTPPPTSCRIDHVPLLYACQASNCSERFAQKAQLRRHMKRHATQVHACDQCAARYSHPKNLREHKQTKHEGRRYKCDFPGCPDVIAQKKNLKRHKKQIHCAPPEQLLNLLQSENR